MPEIRRADPIARRRAVVLLLVGTIVGALLIAAFERYRPLLREWLGADPRTVAPRAWLGLVVLEGFLVAPVVAFAVHCWRLGAAVLRTGQFPPAGHPVMLDTQVMEGPAAALRGRIFKLLAIALGVATVMLWVLLWRLARLLVPGAA